MKRLTFILALAGTAVLVSGCVNPDGTQNNTATGALVGGAFGALTGAAIGGCHGGPDALFGAAAGAQMMPGKVKFRHDAVFVEKGAVALREFAQRGGRGLGRFAVAVTVGEVHAAAGDEDFGIAIRLLNGVEFGSRLGMAP